MKYLAIPFLILSTTLLAQPKFDDVDIIYGPIFKASKRSVPSGFVGNDESGFYVQYSGGKVGQGKLSLYKFGYDLKPVIDKDLFFSTRGLNYYSKNIFMLKGNLYQISESNSSDEKRLILTRINKATFSLENPNEFGIINPENRSASLSQTQLSFAKDSSYFSYTYTIPGRRKDSEKFGVHVFDANAKIAWSEIFELPYANKLLDITTQRVDRNGNLHMLAKRYFNKRRDRIDGQVNYDFLLFSISPDGKLDSIKIESEGKFLRDMQVEITETGDIISAGFYSEKSNYLTGGAFYMRIDGKTKQVMASSFKEFDIDFLTSNLKERKAERLKKQIEEGKEVELPSYFIDELITNSDGTTRLIGEKRLIFTQYFYTPYGGYSITYYYFDDMVAVQIDKDGEIEWAKRIAKKQHTSGDRASYSSYALLDRPDETILLFNDNEKNATYNGTGRVAPMIKGSVNVLMMAKIDSNGRVTRKGLIRQGEADIKMRPNFSQKINENELLVFGHKGLKTQRFILMRFK